ncbi:MAG: Tagatose-bisphosphate aldolase [Candidatus Magasanikbacteria bacterium GW2011_GWC2_34_16]|uniref:Tagatose-bisphosphate aldolase n=2 Tax=Candidatus Magasanikiibacteriota TaxID=1752731 RepID=A0A0G0HE76_9BACT|nr:MAG: Tagatose-bisphosphate aldolase [Candidatus Magasanikbacteria bacterium GW2011_GWC2_34_16]KKQ40502.1 MAG: Tagatose-bisphosphate aldolase [Candidatus Magasanikbacteria bacterium GW2011_GWA2_37_8]
MSINQFTKNGKFLMLALDHRDSFKQYINKINPDFVNNDDLILVKKAIIDATRENFSGVLLDPDWGYHAYTNPDKPFLLSLEKSGYTDIAGERNTVLQYSAIQLVGWGASGAKLLVYFNPVAKKEMEHQIEVTRQALEDCQKNNLPLFLEIVTYGNEALDKSRAEWVLESLQQFISAGIKPDVWKLEYPGSAAACAEITKLVGDTPWILLTRGEDYEIFKEQLKIALANGAVGFLAGRAIWQEIKNFDTIKLKQDFLNTVAAKRFKEICEIALG